MDLGDEFEYGHLFLTERKCRACGKTKNLMSDFYRTHKDRGDTPSAYSYECKMCTKERVVEYRRNKEQRRDWLYPDW